MKRVEQQLDGLLGPNELSIDRSPGGRVDPRPGASVTGARRLLVFVVVIMDVVGFEPSGALNARGRLDALVRREVNRLPVAVADEHRRDYFAELRVINMSCNGGRPSGAGMIRSSVPDESAGLRCKCAEGTARGRAGPPKASRPQS